MKLVVRVFFSWLPFAITIVGLSLLVYGAVQQNYRESLNDPQIQMAEDAAASLENGASPSSVVGSGTVDIANSLAPWIAVYNNDGVALFSSGQLNGAMPQIPQGVFLATLNSSGKDTNQSDENRVTWQPQSGVREAIVVVYNGAEYVVAGRNMREVEDRESKLGFMVFTAMGVLLLATLGSIFLKQIFGR